MSCCPYNGGEGRRASAHPIRFLTRAFPVNLARYSHGAAAYALRAEVNTRLFILRDMARTAIHAGFTDTVKPVHVVVSRARTRPNPRPCRKRTANPVFNLPSGQRKMPSRRRRYLRCAQRDGIWRRKHSGGGR